MKPPSNKPPDDGSEDVEVWDLSAVIDQHVVNDFENDIPTLVETRHICPGCAGRQVRLEATEQPPASHAEAWQCGPMRDGKPLWSEGACRGNNTTPPTGEGDLGWYWCRASIEHGYTGTLVIVSKPGVGGMIVLFFPDRRISRRPVEVERRALPRGKP